jgi:hypothetical protein
MIGDIDRNGNTQISKNRWQNYFGGLSNPKCFRKSKGNGYTYWVAK